MATPGALAALGTAAVAAETLLARHAAGDWGDVDADDRRANEAAVATGARLLSAYPLGPGVRVWVITEAADEAGRRASTCLLLPEEY